MGNFRDNQRGGFRGRSGGSRFGGGRSGGFRDRDNFRGGRDSDRKPSEMFEAICDKCGKTCQVPFKPTGSKPVLCSDCFRNDSGRGSGSRGQDSGGSSEQFNQINAKLDKILLVLQSLELEVDDESEDDEDQEDFDEDDSEEESESDL